MRAKSKVGVFRKMNTELMFSSEKEDWETPQDFFDNLNSEFGFTLDAAASLTNHKCDKYYSIENNGLEQEWDQSTYCNPPYGRGVFSWVQKAYFESLKGKTIVMLLPARTDTRWFHEFILGKAEIRFIKGRLKFGGSKNSAPFPSMVVVYRGDKNDC